jgi:hypothetical protein
MRFISSQDIKGSRGASQLKNVRGVDADLKELGVVVLPLKISRPSSASLSAAERCLSEC